MTSLHTSKPATATPRAYRLPDIPEKHPDDMTSYDHLAKGGNVGRVKIRLGQPETTIVSGEHYICTAPGSPVRYPDMLVAFGSGPDLYKANSGLEIASTEPGTLTLE